MSNETLMGDIGLSTQWLISGATDLLRANARFGTTQVLKMAHFAELYDTNIEMNAEGGLFGLVHAHLGCCIDNTQFYEAGPDMLQGARGAVGRVGRPAHGPSIGGRRGPAQTANGPALAAHS